MSGRQLKNLLLRAEGVNENEPPYILINDGELYIIDHWLIRDLKGPKVFSRLLRDWAWKVQ